MPEWMHNRAEHILAKNPSMPKSEAFAIATQQMHAVGKSPKGYGTAEGKRTAKAKYDTPKDDKKTANPGGLESPKMDKKAFYEALADEFEQIVKAGFTISQYSGPLSYGPFKMTSGLPHKPPPRLDESPVEVKKAGVITPTGITPKARLSSGMRIGAPKVTAPSGPSISQISKPKGFGQPLAGATIKQ